MMNINKSDNDKCRLCLSEYDKSDLIPIFNESEPHELSLAARIMICLSLPVQASDSLPDSVCKNCEKSVTQFYVFRENCLNAYFTLLSQATQYNVNKTFNSEERDGSLSKFDTNPSNFDDNADHECAKLDFTKLVKYDVDSGKKSETICNGKFDTEFNNEKTFVQNHQNDPLSDELNNETAMTQTLDGQANENHSSNENFSGDLNLTDNSTEIIRYKCLRCDNLFSDLESASVHCSQCTRIPEDDVDDHDDDDDNDDDDDDDDDEDDDDDGDDDNDDDHDEDLDFVERAESVEYLDENFIEQTENSENKEETREEISTSTRKLCDIKLRNERGSSQISLMRNNGKLMTTRKLSIVDEKKINELKSANHSCPNCESKFSNAALLRRHMVVHTGERPFQCPICKKYFSQLGQLNFHKNFHTNPRYRCDICEKPFLRPSDIKKHMRTHTGEKPYECTQCEKSFAQMVALRQHERIHSGDKPFGCEICGKRFSQKANMTKHLKIHKEGAKPYTCGVCGRSFSDLEEMKLHRAGHGGGKPRKCNYCEESFRKMSELSLHTRRFHTFEKPHQCAFCQKAFYSLSNLKQHVMVHTGQKPHRCPRCNKQFTQKGNLTKHFERKHGDRASNEENYIVIEENECCNETKDEMMMINDDLAKNINESFIIEREETVEIERTENHVDEEHLQLYKIV